MSASISTRLSTMAHSNCDTKVFLHIYQVGKPCARLSTMTHCNRETMADQQSSVICSQFGGSSNSKNKEKKQPRKANMVKLGSSRGKYMKRMEQLSQQWVQKKKLLGEVVCSIDDRMNVASKHNS